MRYDFLLMAITAWLTSREPWTLPRRTWVGKVSEGPGGGASCCDVRSTYIVLTFGVAQDAGFQDEVALEEEKYG